MQHPHKVFESCNPTDLSQQVLELLYRNSWSSIDGLGGLIISPTKELATQIFEELRSVGRYHNFSAGLLIGGHKVEVEKSSVDQMNLLVATPGRLLQHMDETYGFDASALQVSMCKQEYHERYTLFESFVQACVGDKKSPPE